MIELIQKWNNINIVNSDKKVIDFDTTTNIVLLDWFDMTFPWEYEKWGILLEVKPYQNNFNKLVKKVTGETYVAG
mgnify:CR=1 FL=1